MSHPWPVGPGPLEHTSESDHASLSPRTTLLSPPFEDDVALQDLPTRIPRGPGIKFRHERERAHSTASSRELLHMLVSEEYESKQTRKILYTAFDRLEQETRRAEAAEARIEETVQRARAINDARTAAQQQAVRAQEELKLYKMQLDNAQKEILRAQDVLTAIEAQRDEAEAAAVSARSKARRLNEERLIELAREEGRRLGFEEGVRRGRRIGYREAYSAGIDDQHDDVREVATAVVDRLLEHPDEPERIEAPSTSRSARDGHRPKTPVDSSLENRRHSRHESTETLNRSTSTLRRAAVVDPRISSTSTPSQSWSGPPADAQFTRPISIQSSPPSVRHSEFHVPPDNYIPTVDADRNISLPPPHGMQRSIPSPTPSQRALGHASSRAYMYDHYPQPRRASPDDESLTSTKQSASTISQLDIVSLPANARRRDRPPNLSVIHEDTSMRSDYSQTASEAGRSSFRETASTETLRRKSKQQLADELRYSDPSTPEQWRRQSESSRSHQSHDAPPRHRPPQITIPTPLSPPRVLQQPESRHRRTTSGRQGRPDTRSEYRDQRRPLSSDSSVPEINVEPPSGPPSDAPSRGHGNVPTRGLLSPDHANLPLPIPEPPAPNGRRSPGPSSPVTRQANLADQFYAGPPEHAPVIPQNTGGRYSVPYVPPPSSDGRSRSPVSFYAASPVPAGVTYPAPPVPRSATSNANTYPPGSASNPSVASDGRRRHDSLSATAGMTPASRTKPVQSTASSTDGGGGSRRHPSRRQSSGSLASQQSQSRPSYSRYDPDVYNDPAFLASSDSFVDSVTDANTAANGGGGPVRPVRVHGSPAYSYATND